MLAARSVQQQRRLICFDLPFCSPLPLASVCRRRENYLFSCHCQRCQDEAEQPDNTSEEEIDDDEDDTMDSFS